VAITSNCRGALWLRETTRVALRYGHWGVSSFDGAIKKCVAEVGGFETVVIRFDRPAPSLVFWFLGSGPGGCHELIMGLSSESAADEEMLLSIGRSVRRRRT
jgi:hypothetical protein